MNLTHYLDYQKLYETFEHEIGEELQKEMKTYFENYLQEAWKVFQNKDTLEEMTELLKSMGRETVLFPFNYGEKMSEEFIEDDLIDYDLENLIGDSVTMLFYAREIELAQKKGDDLLIEKKIKRFNSAINEDEVSVCYTIAFIPQ